MYQIFYLEMTLTIIIKEITKEFFIYNLTKLKSIYCEKCLVTKIKCKIKPGKYLSQYSKGLIVFTIKNKIKQNKQNPHKLIKDIKRIDSNFLWTRMVCCCQLLTQLKAVFPLGLGLRHLPNHTSTTQ